jgi:hypothetical protein
MMRSQRQRKRSFRHGTFDHPFFWLAVIAGLAVAALHYAQPSPGSSLHGLLSWLWNNLGFGFHWMDNFLDFVLPGLERGLRIAFVALTGLLPYLVADAVWQWLYQTVRNR